MKKLFKLIILFITIITFAGCTIKDEGKMVINEDGSLKYEILLTYEKNILKTLLESENKEVNDNNIKDLINNLESTLHTDLKKEKYEDENFIGYKYTYEVDHIDKISSKENNKVNITNIQTNEKLSEKKLFTKLEDKGITKYSSNMYYELMHINENYNKENDKLEYEIKFNITLPYASLSNNADEISEDGKILTWYINGNKKQDIKFTFSLTNINLIYKVSIMAGIILVLFIITFIISRKKKKKIKTLCYILFVILSIISCVIISNLNKTVIKLPELQVNNNKNEIDYNTEQKIITLDFKNIDNTTEEINNIIQNKTTKKEIYTNVITKLMKNDKETKMYEQEKQLILETKLNKETTKNLFEINEDVLLKIIFDNDLENKDIYDINYQINKSKIIRENIVKTAVAQEGKTGHTYWEWYGHNSFIEWCAAFVSWVANEHGQIEAGNVPKFAWVKIGVDFYKEKGWFKYNKEYDNPLPGDVIFFNWNNANDLIDHVGLVEKFEDGYVYTIEGNVGGGNSPDKASSRKVLRKKYAKDSIHIYGYGVPEY